ncbi:DUF4235 domain-containing protein [Kitasatospora purpeofusca]|uniref:DUF4235 domain-containing protein n=1 Tax=Kitasatospora purpeofusca TaxID=67352 RepID=UPI002A59CAAE|nr:DUF4235 domain-containing protein [Kitasatospora purpeofusca]MDY0810858.1 DUF4235 domain-containing protein [Kitasatospora purpeofusca]
MSRILYKPLGLLAGALGGVVAGAVFKRLWALLGHEDEAPTATDPERTWAEVLAAATLQGAVFALVKAVVERGGAVGARRLTGTWPG